ncbi:hypothetical protein EsH8_II_001197 [Colletotrichum jinshuiense]
MWLLKVATIAAAFAAGLQIDPVQPVHATSGDVGLVNVNGCCCDYTSTAAAAAATITTTTTAAIINIDIDDIDNFNDTTTGTYHATSPANNDSGTLNFNSGQDDILSRTSTTTTTTTASFYIVSEASSDHDYSTTSVFSSVTKNLSPSECISGDANCSTGNYKQPSWRTAAAPARSSAATAACSTGHRSV